MQNYCDYTIQILNKYKNYLLSNKHLTIFNTNVMFKNSSFGVFIKHSVRKTKVKNGGVVNNFN